MSQLNKKIEVAISYLGCSKIPVASPSFMAIQCETELYAARQFVH